MLRRATLPRFGSPLAAIRAHFELPQWEMAGLLQVSENYYRLLEAGKRSLNARNLLLVVALTQAMALAAAPAPPLGLALAPPPPVGLPAYRAAHVRLLGCLLKRYRLQRQTLGYARGDRAAAHWLAALPTLRAHPAFADARAQKWLAVRNAEELPLAERIERHLLDARIAGLTAEITSLQALLAAA